MAADQAGFKLPDLGQTSLNSAVVQHILDAVLRDPLVRDVGEMSLSIMLNKPTTHTHPVV